MPVIFSDGSGLAGVYIALDWSIEQYLTENEVDILGCVAKLRKQKPNMVNNKASSYIYMQQITSNCDIYIA